MKSKKKKWRAQLPEERMFFVLRMNEFSRLKNSIYRMCLQVVFNIFFFLCREPCTLPTPLHCSFTPTKPWMLIHAFQLPLHCTLHYCRPACTAHCTLHWCAAHCTLHATHNCTTIKICDINKHWGIVPRLKKSHEKSGKWWNNRENELIPYFSGNFKYIPGGNIWVILG